MDPRVNSGLRGFTRARIVVVGFMQIRMGSLRRDRPSCGQFHSGSRWFTLVHLRFVGFIPVRVGSIGGRRVTVD